MKFDSTKLSDKIYNEYMHSGQGVDNSMAQLAGRLQFLLQLAMDGHPDEVQQRYEEIMGDEK